MAKFDIIGKRFGRLIVLGLSHSIKYDYGTKVFYHHVYECQCECGKVCQVRRSNLLNGNTRSCGCLNSELTKNRNIRHGQYNRDRLVKINNQIKTIKQWAEEKGIPIRVLAYRVKANWSEERLLQPVRGAVK